MTGDSIAVIIAPRTRRIVTYVTLFRFCFISALKSERMTAAVALPPKTRTPIWAAPIIVSMAPATTRAAKIPSINGRSITVARSRVGVVPMSENREVIGWGFSELLDISDGHDTVRDSPQRRV